MGFFGNTERLIFSSLVFSIQLQRRLAVGARAAFFWRSSLPAASTIGN